MQWMVDNMDVLLAILGALLPTLVAGLTKKPEAATATAEAIRLARKLSFARHKDEPGTFTVPFSKVK